ncbi:MAG: helix-turn-helix transcriptional regulator [Ruminococcaceae bacterium]|nr:helix-turn-helix transcriptional regulator [Oscillospiraceae bacterium]
MFEYLPNTIMKYELLRMNITVEEATYVKLDNGWRREWISTYPFTRIYLITNGQGEIECNGKRIILYPGNIYIIPSGAYFRFFCDDYMEKLYFHIKLLKYDGMDLLSELGECVILANQQKIIDDAVKNYYDKDMLSAVNLKTIIYSIVSLALGNVNRPIEIKKYSPLTKQIIRYIDENLTNELNIERICEHTFVSRSKVQAVFCNEVGIPVGTYIKKRLIEKAEEMLRKTEFSSKEISNILKFCDESYFVRVFKKVYGMTPKKYRKMMG